MVSGVPLAPSRHRPSLPIQVWGQGDQGCDTAPGWDEVSPPGPHPARSSARCSAHVQAPGALPEPIMGGRMLRAELAADLPHATPRLCWRSHRRTLGDDPRSTSGCSPCSSAPGTEGKQRKPGLYRQQGARGQQSSPVPSAAPPGPSPRPAPPWRCPRRGRQQPGLSRRLSACRSISSLRRLSAPFSSDPITGTCQLLAARRGRGDRHQAQQRY